MAHSFRKALNSYAPALTQLYREIRDKRDLAKPLPTPYDFMLAGPAGMAGSNWEVNEIRAFLGFIEERPACIDIGANVGFYSCLAATRGKHVVAIEPLPRNVQFLCRNLAYNNLWDVEVYQMALSSRPGVKQLWGRAHTASLIRAWAGATDSEQVGVPVTTLDLIAAERFSGVPLTIKMDVESFELEVLKGASRTLRLEPKPAWLVEIFLTGIAIPGGINEKFHETFGVFWDNGYRSYQTAPGRPLVQPQEGNRWVG